MDKLEMGNLTSSWRRCLCYRSRSPQSIVGLGLGLRLELGLWRVVLLGRSLRSRCLVSLVVCGVSCIEYTPCMYLWRKIGLLEKKAPASGREVGCRGGVYLVVDEQRRLESLRGRHLIEMLGGRTRR